MTQSSAPKAPPKSQTALGSLTADELSCVLRELLAAHPELQDQAEGVASTLLTTVSAERSARAVAKPIPDVPPVTNMFVLDLPVSTSYSRLFSINDN